MLSTYGVMFTPNPARAAAELVRCCRPGGRIGLANWTPEGFVGGMFKIIGQHVPPPAGVPSPMQWGMDDRLHDLFAGVERADITRRHFTFRYESAQHFFDTFITYYGPMVRAWAALDDDGRASLQQQLVALAETANRSTDGTLKVPSEYVEVVVTR